MNDSNPREAGPVSDETIDDPSRLVFDGDDPFDRLAEEFADRYRRGEEPSIAEYEARHPEHAARLRALLPTVAMMERLKAASSPGRHDLHEDGHEAGPVSYTHLTLPTTPYV